MGVDWKCSEIEFVAINEPYATAETLVLLLQFDTVPGRWSQTCSAGSDGTLVVGASPLGLTPWTSPSEIEWRPLSVDVVLECSEKFRETC
ncbi:MAG: hypothetical protein JKY61_04730 [Planctomycetes bacterium]|nr:hypothetical protein [Planctomycetota bacterium]